jgi:hypothetical protein
MKEPMTGMASMTTQNVSHQRMADSLSPSHSRTSFWESSYSGASRPKVSKRLSSCSWESMGAAPLSLAVVLASASASWA